MDVWLKPEDVDAVRDPDPMFAPGDLVTTYAPDEEPPRTSAGMLLYKDYDSPRGSTFDKSSSPPFKVAWKSVGIVLSTGLYEAWDGTSRVLVMIDGKVGWNTAKCFRHVGHADLGELSPAVLALLRMP